MPPHDGEKYVRVLAVGAICRVLAELNVAMFRPLSAEILSPAKQNDFSDVSYGILYNMVS